MDREVPTCRNKKDIEENHGKVVRVVGTYTHKAAFKGQPSFLVSFIELEDDTEVVIAYGPDAARMVMLQDKQVEAFGKIHKGPPDDKEQYLELPHLTELTEITRR